MSVYGAAQHRLIKTTDAAITANGAQAAGVANLSHQVAQSAVAFLRIGTVSGTSPSLTLKLQGSADGTNWADIPSAAFPAQTAATAAGTAIRLPVTGLLDPYIRAAWTVSGTTPSFSSIQCDIFFPNPDSQ